MLLTPHIAVGAAVGLATGNPVFGFFAGWASHHICDAIPHVDTGSDDITVENIFKNKKALAFVYFDIFLSIIIFFIMLLKTNYSLPVMWGAFGGVLPDVADNIPFWSYKIRKYPFFKQLHFIHEKFHFTAKGKLRLLGWTTQIVLIVTAFGYVFTR